MIFNHTKANRNQVTGVQTRKIKCLWRFSHSVGSLPQLCHGSMMLQKVYSLSSAEVQCVLVHHSGVGIKHFNLVAATSQILGVDHRLCTCKPALIIHLCPILLTVLELTSYCIEVSLLKCTEVRLRWRLYLLHSLEKSLWHNRMWAAASCINSAVVYGAPKMPTA